MDYLAVAIAGFMGAITRKLLSDLLHYPGISIFPVNTLFINLTGCFILSLFMTVTVNRLRINPRLRVGIGTGFLGAYTTFSTFALEAVNLIRTDHIFYALAYSMFTSFGCVFFAWVGLVLGRVIAERPRDSAGNL